MRTDDTPETVNGTPVELPDVAEPIETLETEIPADDDDDDAVEGDEPEAA